MFNLIIFILLPILPQILGIFLFVNASESHILRQIMPLMEHFIIQENYFYLILLYIDTAMCIGAIALIATGTLLLAYLKHACGMFRIAR
jgi:hypothetical protein